MGTRVFVGRVPGSAREKDLERFFKGYGRLQEVLMKNGYSFVEFDDARDADDAVYELNGKELMGERLIVEHARASRGRGGGMDRRGGGRGYGGGYSGGGGGGYGGGGGGYGGGGGGGGGGRSFGGGGRYENRRGGGGGDRYGPPQRTDYRLTVENLSSRASWQDLKDHMRQAGEVTFADAHKQRMGEGVVEYASERDMKKAMDKLDGTEINGKTIKLTEERPYSGRSRKRSYSRSRSRSRSSRSRSRSNSRSRSRSATPQKKVRSRSKSYDDKD